MFNQDFREFIQSLNDNQVRCLVVVGYAVALHGYPRYTKDMDIWIDMTSENARSMLKALDQFGFASLGLKEKDFLVDDQIIQLGYAPRRIKKHPDDYRIWLTWRNWNSRITQWQPT